MKKWYKSKALWLGIAGMVTAVVDYLETGGDWRGAVLVGFGVLSIVIRAVTKEGIVFRDDSIPGLNIPDHQPRPTSDNDIQELGNIKNDKM